MADFSDMQEASASKWSQILENAGVKVPHGFPYSSYYKMLREMGKIETKEEGERDFNRLVEENPRKAIFQLTFYAVMNLIQDNSLAFITQPELNIEFRDLFLQAGGYQVDVPPSLVL